MRLSKDVKMAIHLESANFCSGNGIDKNEPTELLAADLQAMSRPSEGDLTIGWVKSDFEEKRDLPAGQYPNETHFRGFIAEESNGNFLLQDSIWFDLAYDTTHGSISDSFDLRIDDGDGEKDLYGCIITDYELHAELGERIKQSVTWKATQHKISGTTAIIGGIDDFNTTQVPLTYKDISTLTIDSIPINTLQGVTLDLRITNELIDEKLQRHFASGNLSKYVLNPAHNTQVVELELEFTGGSGNTWFADLCNELPQRFNIDLVIGSILDISMTNLRVLEFPQTDIQGHGVIPLRLKCISSAGFTITKNT